MRVITASIFAIVWASVHAVVDIASLDKFKEKYASLITSGSTSAKSANAAITGAAEPELATLEPLWSWYRAVDASHKALAKQVMDQAASNPLSSALTLATFKSTFDTLLKSGNALDATNVDAKWAMVTAILGDSKPAPANVDAWRAYHGLDADSQAYAKTSMMEGEFVKLFEKSWKADVRPTYKALMFARANTMNVKTKGKEFNTGTNIVDNLSGKETNLIYAAVSDNLREQMVRIMG